MKTLNVSHWRPLAKQSLWAHFRRLARLAQFRAAGPSLSHELFKGCPIFVGESGVIGLKLDQVSPQRALNLALVLL
jgi:hypothetical protein